MWFGYFLFYWFDGVCVLLKCCCYGLQMQLGWGCNIFRQWFWFLLINLVQEGVCLVEQVNNWLWGNIYDDGEYCIYDEGDLFGDGGFGNFYGVVVFFCGLEKYYDDDVQIEGCCYQGEQYFN